MAQTTFSRFPNSHYPETDTDLYEARAYWIDRYKATKDPYALRCALECARAIKWCRENDVPTSGHGAWKKKGE